MTDNPYVRPDAQTMLEMLAAHGGPALHEVEPVVARQLYIGLSQLADPLRGDLADVQDISIPGPDDSAIAARLYRPHLGAEPAPVLLFFHGGGWVIGGLESHDSACAEIARLLGLDVLAVDYRLAPEHRFPAAIEDSLAAAKWLTQSPEAIGHPVLGIILAGDSAGGNLAASVSQQLHGLLAAPIIAQWLIYPAVDMNADSGSMAEFAEGYMLTRASIDWFAASYIENDADRASPLSSPLLAASLDGQPPTLVFTCGLDPLRDQGRAYAARLINAGVRTVFREAEGQIHGSLTMRAGIPSAQQDLIDNIAALKELIAE